MARRLAAPLAAVWGALGAIYLIWGSTYLGIELAIETLPPLLMASVRFLIAGAVLFVIFRPRERPTLRHWRAAAIVGGLLLVGGNGMVGVAQKWIDSGVAALLVASMPLWLALFDYGATRRRLAPQALVGIAIGFVGIALLIRPGGGINPLGALIGLLAPVSWSIGSLYARTASLPRNLLLGSGMEMLAAGVMLAVVGLAVGERVDVESVSATSVAAVAYLIVVGSIVAFSCYVWLLKVAPTELVSTYAYVNPIVAVLLGAVFLDEPLTVWVLVAGAAIVVSVALIVRAQSRPETVVRAIEREQEGATLAA